MNVLIVYGTPEGQTRKIAERAGRHIRSRGHVVELYDSASLAPLDIDGFHAVVVAASVHQERHSRLCPHPRGSRASRTEARPEWARFCAGRAAAS